MADYYRSLASAALEDAVSSEESDIDPDKMVGDVDELEAGLFGPALSAPIKVPSTTPQRSSSSAEPAASKPSRTVEPPVTKSALPAGSQDHKASKSRLLEELFGPSSVEKPHSSLDKPQFHIPAVVGHREERQPPSGPRSGGQPSLPDSTAGDSLGYQPSAQRRRRAVPPAAPKPDDLWTQFLQPDPEPVQAPSLPQILSPDGPRSRETGPLSTTKVIRSPERTQGIAQRAVEATFAASASPQPSLDRQVLIPERSAEESFALIKRYIEELIQEKMAEVENLTGELNLKMEAVEQDVQGLESAREKERTAQNDLRDDFDAKHKELQDSQERGSEAIQDLQEKLNDVEASYSSQIGHLKTSLSDEREETHGHLSSLQRQINSLEYTQDKLEERLVTEVKEVRTLIAQRTSDTAATIREELRAEVDEVTALIRAVETQVTRLSERLQQQRVEAAEREGLEGRICALEGRLGSESRGAAGWREHLEARVDQLEGALQSRLQSTRQQQARLCAWQEQQVADLAAYQEQRLWGLYSLLQRQRREMASSLQQAGEPQEVGVLPAVRKELAGLRARLEEAEEQREHRLKTLEQRVSTAETEGSRLSRLAERVLGLLQMWETRHKMAARAESDTLMALQQRCDLAIVERNLMMDKPPSVSSPTIK